MNNDFDILKNKLLKISQEFIEKYEGKNKELNDLINYLKGIEKEFNHYLKNEHRTK